MCSVMMVRKESLEFDAIGDTVTPRSRQCNASQCSTASKMRYLSIVKLNSISIPPSPIPVVNDIFNISQSFTIQDNGAKKLSSTSEAAQTDDNVLDIFSWGDSKISSSTTMPNLTCSDGQEGISDELDDSSTTLIESGLSSASFSPREKVTKQTKLPFNTLRTKSKIAKNQPTSPDPTGCSDLSMATCSSPKTSSQTQRQISLMVEKLQSDQWEICIEGLVKFTSIGETFDWEAESNFRYSQIVSRKLIDLMRSLRSNVSKIACRIAGDYFVITKSTRRPEFDEITLGLLLKCADSNKFIRLDAFTALEKMIRSINYNHSLRVICSSNASTHKNPLTRAAVMKLLYSICEDIGPDRILNSEANQRVKKYVMENLAQFLVDKDQSVRSYAERLCKFLSSHEHFVANFFKSVDPKQKTKLMKIFKNLKIY